MSADNKKTDDAISRMSDDELLAYGKALIAEGGTTPEYAEHLKATTLVFEKAVKAEKAAMEVLQVANANLTAAAVRLAQKSPALALIKLRAAAEKHEQAEKARKK